jgi:hypothetical protein
MNMRSFAAALAAANAYGATQAATADVDGRP